MVERAVQLVDGVRAEGISDLGAIERDADDALGDMTVVRDVGEVLEAGDGTPELRIEGHGPKDMPRPSVCRAVPHARTAPFRR